MKSDCLIVHREEKTREELARLVRSQKKKRCSDGKKMKEEKR